MADFQARDATASARALGPAAGTGYLLWQVVNHWQRRQKRALSPYGVTPVQYLLLAGLSDLAAAGDGPVTQSILARHCGTDVMMTSQVLRVLERNRLVRRHTHSDDGRAVAVAITPDGQTVVQRAAEAANRIEADFFAALGGDVAAFGDALTLLTGRKPRRRVPARRG